jgi:hypothetical protein
MLEGISTTFDKSSGYSVFYIVDHSDTLCTDVSPDKVCAGRLVST